MGLTLEELKLLQHEAMADDVDIDEEVMSKWTDVQARSYFESGGTIQPLPEGGERDEDIQSRARASSRPDKPVPESIKSRDHALESLDMALDDGFEVRLRCPEPAPRHPPPPPPLPFQRHPAADWSPNVRLPAARQVDAAPAFQSEGGAPPLRLERADSNMGVPAEQVKAAFPPRPAGSKHAKVVIVGDAGVGKTALLLRFAQQFYSSSTRATVGVDLHTRAVALPAASRHEEAGEVSLQVWDTAGQEVFHALTASYFRQSHAVILMCVAHLPPPESRQRAGPPDQLRAGAAP